MLSLYDYTKAVEMKREDRPFYALLAAAMMRSDTDNATILRSAYPHIWNTLQERYDNPGGLTNQELESKQNE